MNTGTAATEDELNEEIARQITIGSRLIGAGRPAYIISEIGSNHDGSLEMALELVRRSAEAGVDAVKMQAFRRETLLAPDLPGGEGRRESDRKLLRRRWDLLPKYTVPETWWAPIADAAEGHGVDLLVTAFDLDRLQHLDARLGCPAHKIASGDITWLELIEAAARTGKPVILSTGASTLEETERAVAALEHGGAREYALLHCVSTYPPAWEDANLRAMETLRERFSVPVGLSDHSPGSTLPVAAVTLGAAVIEKHITLERRSEGLDHHFALEPHEFCQLVEDVRHAEAALGSGEKRWAESEEVERYWVRRGLWAAQDLAEGAVLEREDVLAVRPREGLGAERLEHVIGKTLRVPLTRGEPLKESHLL